VAPAPGVRRQRLRCRPVRLTGCRPANRPVRPLLVVGEAERVELCPEPGEAGGCWPLPQPALEGLVEALDLALGPRVARCPVLLADPEPGE
jgi:hypothetical protein